LQSLKIANFDIELFEKLLTKKGLDISKYSVAEMPVLKKIEEEMQNRAGLIQEQILNIIENYNFENIDRIFIISEYGDIPGINVFFEKNLGKKSLGFKFYKEYNLDRLPVDPFLFLAMLETYYAYNENDLKYNYSLFLRKPTFLYRPSGMLISSIVLLIILLSAYPVYLYITGEIFLHKTKTLNNKLNRINNQKTDLLKDINNIKNTLNKIKKQINIYASDIKNKQKIIQTLYEFKYSYIPKSKEMVDITLLMNKNKIYLQSMDYENNIFTMKIYSHNDKKIGKFLDSLVQNGFNVDFNKVEEKDGKYYTTIRIKE